MTQFWFAASTEEFPPSQMVEQATAAGKAGFDGLATSDHFAPWFPEGAGTSAWAVLPAMASQVPDGPFGTAVTPIVHHYHPGFVAQYWMSLEELFPGRPYLGVGSGEALNEVPLGLDWPEPGEMLERFDQGLDAIWRLWHGETVTMDAGWFRLKEAKLYTRAGDRRPRMYVSAFGPKAAAIAGKRGDGLWTLGDPDSAPEVIDAYKEACERHGKEVGEIIVQSGFHLSDDEQEAIAHARKWKATQLDEVYLRDLHDPAEMTAKAHAQMSDEEFAKEGFMVGADAGEQVERIRQMQELGATVVCLQLMGDHDPLGSIRRYGDEVLPALRKTPV
ncbi:LLM class flavin-dependent oxidoreductase [Conexibacter sp. SYSU D00693]|uniref:LLM class flavin-dependent oxidoreductase n=1 Tax=Conexibacter sp. SYSU D00693 TaxID=2812560 RepID=UPI00196AF7D2|nr:LLM class flavin-dependent oxidoreductase [Conexibacter sp. SYSU D00693]